MGVIGAAISRDLDHAGQAVTDRRYVKADTGAAARAGQMASAMAPRRPLKLVRD